MFVGALPPPRAMCVSSSSGTLLALHGASHRPRSLLPGPLDRELAEGDSDVYPLTFADDAERVLAFRHRRRLRRLAGARVRFALNIGAEELRDAAGVGERADAVDRRTAERDPAAFRRDPHPRTLPVVARDRAAARRGLVEGRPTAEGELHMALCVGERRQGEGEEQ